jgi:hypothetical protein
MLFQEIGMKKQQSNIGVIQVIVFMWQSLKNKFLEHILFMKIRKAVVHMFDPLIIFHHFIHFDGAEICNLLIQEESLSKNS